MSQAMVRNILLFLLGAAIVIFAILLIRTS